MATGGKLSAEPLEVSPKCRAKCASRMPERCVGPCWPHRVFLRRTFRIALLLGLRDSSLTES